MPIVFGENAPYTKIDHLVRYIKKNINKKQTNKQTKQTYVDNFGSNFFDQNN